MDNKSFSIDLYDENIYNEYGVSNSELLQDELCDTIEKISNTHKIKTNLIINFSKPKQSVLDEKEFVNAFKNTYESKVSMKKHEVNRCIITGGIMLFIGIAMLCLDIFVFEPLNYLAYEFFNVFSWVFCWCAIEALTIQLIQLIIEVNKYKKILNARIKFTEKGSND